MTLQIKLIILGILLALLAGEQYWVYNKGFKVGQAECVDAQVKALKQSLKDQEKQFKDQREAEMREAAKTSKQLIINEQKKVKSLQDANAILRDPKNQTWAVLPLDDNIVSVLNRSRGDPTTESTQSPASGEHGKVPPSA